MTARGVENLNLVNKDVAFYRLPVRILNLRCVENLALGPRVNLKRRQMELIPLSRWRRCRCLKRFLRVAEHRKIADASE